MPGIITFPDPTEATVQKYGSRQARRREAYLFDLEWQPTFYNPDAPSNIVSDVPDTDVKTIILERNLWRERRGLPAYEYEDEQASDLGDDTAATSDKEEGKGVTVESAEAKVSAAGSDKEDGVEEETWGRSLMSNAPLQPPPGLLRRAQGLEYRPSTGLTLTILPSDSNDRGSRILASWGWVANDERMQQIMSLYKKKCDHDKKPFSPARILKDIAGEDDDLAGILSSEGPEFKDLVERLGSMNDRNPNYKGSVTFFDLLNAETPQHDNTSLFLQKLPLDVNLKEILALVKHDRVFQVSIVPNRGQHKHGAVRLIFMTREGAQAFMDDVSSIDGLYIIRKAQANWKLEKIWRITAVWDRDTVGRGLLWYAALNKSRVVSITGPRQDLISAQHLLSYLDDFVHYQLVEAPTENRLPNDEVQFVFHFAMTRAQADAAEMSWKKFFHDKGRSAHVKIKFLPDPCEPVGWKMKIPASPPAPPPSTMKVSACSTRTAPASESGKATASSNWRAKNASKVSIY